MRPTDLLLLLAAAARAGDVEQRVATIVASLTRQEKLELLNGVGWNQWDIQDGYYVANSARIMTCTPSTRRLLDGVAVRFSDRAAWPVRPRRPQGAKTVRARRFHSSTSST